jgi:hypothetical protein
MSEATRGPWVADKFGVFANVTKDIKVICYTATNNASRTVENLANARLIAMAPEMRDMLQKLPSALRKLTFTQAWSGCRDEMRQYADQIEALLQKANA